MKRRTFLKTAGLAAGMMALPHAARAATDPMDRIGLGTVTFRARFPQTPVPNHPKLEPLALVDVPQYYADRFNVHNVEFWSPHFESIEPAYLDKLRKALEDANSTLINIQVGAQYNISAEDEAQRQQSLKTVKEWIDAAARVGSKSTRINTHDGSVDAAIESFKELNEYSKEKGLILLIENHGGLSSDPETVVKIVEAVDSPNFQTLPDYGNFGDLDPADGLRLLVPYAKHMISSKTDSFTDDWEHASYDYDAYVRLCEELGFPGIYSVEFYDPQHKPIDYEKVVDWMIEHTVDVLQET